MEYFLEWITNITAFIFFPSLVCLPLFFMKYKEKNKNRKIKNNIVENYKYLKDFEDKCFQKTPYGKDTFNIDKWEKGLKIFYEEECGKGEFDFEIVNRIFKEVENEHEFVEKSKEQYIIPEMVKHYAILEMKYRNAHFVDEYGIEQFDDTQFDEDLEYFAKNVLKDETVSKSFLFHCFVEAGNFSEIDDFDLSPVKTGEDYERFVRDLCVSAGFECGMTPKTGDQGVDLIVRTGRIHIAIQCKYYSSSIGNSAVQEVIAGQKYYNCDYACVVSNQDYTDSAKELAKAADIKLLSHETLIPYLKKL